MADDKIIDEFQNNGPTDCALESTNDDQGHTKGQVVHRFVNNFHIHQGGQIVKCGNCGADKTCPRCEPIVGKHLCRICGMWISGHQSHIENHERVHNGERPFKCQLCEQSFKEPSHLKQHQQMHIGAYSYLCEACGDSFRLQTHLDSHQQSVHSNERNFRCEHCLKSFKLRHNLMAHYRRQHKCGYSCPDCGQKLQTRDEFTKHHAQHVKDKTASDSDAGYGNEASFGKDNDEAECSHKV